VRWCASARPSARPASGRARSPSPDDQEEKNAEDEERGERVDLRDGRRRPGRCGQREGQPRRQRTDDPTRKRERLSLPVRRSIGELPRKEGDHRRGRRARERREDRETEEGRPQRDANRDGRKEGVEGVSGRMGDAERPGNGDELGRVTPPDVPRGRHRIHGECDDADGDADRRGRPVTEGPRQPRGRAFSHR
jgi:hypothetical protein